MFLNQGREGAMTALGLACFLVVACSLVFDGLGARLGFAASGTLFTPRARTSPDGSLEYLALEARTGRGEKKKPLGDNQGVRNDVLARVKSEFERKYRAIFKNRCTVCHGPGGLREDRPFLTFDDLLFNPGLLVHTLEGDHGQYAQSDRKNLIRWLTDSLSPAMEKTSAAVRPPLSMPEEFKDQEMYEGWQEKKARAYPHPKNWEKTHRYRARVERNTCSMCHPNQSFCLDCHMKKKPHDHNTRQWISRVHVLKARVQPYRCTSCHQANYCSACHHRPFNNDSSKG